MPRRHTAEAELQPHQFLTLALDGRVGLASCPGNFLSSEIPPPIAFLVTTLVSVRFSQQRTAH